MAVLQIDPTDPEPQKIRQVIECLQDAGIIIYPTDTVYGLGCHIRKSRAVERICRIKDIRVERARFSFLFADLSQISAYTKPVSNPVYKAMRKTLPGPFTFILNAGNDIPRIFRTRRSTVGIRIPDHPICQRLISELQEPLMNTSLHDEEDTMMEYLSDPADIIERYQHQVDLIIDGGAGQLTASTVVDCSKGEIELIREGLGDPELL